MLLNYQSVWVFYTQAKESTDRVEDEQPAWAPLRDNYMLTSSKLKDWDKMPVSNLWSCIYFYATQVACTHHFAFLQDKNVSDDMGKTSEDSSSDED